MRLDLCLSNLAVDAAKHMARMGKKKHLCEGHSTVALGKWASRLTKEDFQNASMPSKYRDMIVNMDRVSFV